MASDDCVANVGAISEALALVIDVDPWPFERFSATSPPPPSSSATNQISLWKSISFFSYWNAVLEFIAQYKTLYARSYILLIVCHATDSRFLFRGAAGDLDIANLDKLLFSRMMSLLNSKGMSLVSTGVAQGLASLALVRSKNAEMKARVLAIMYQSPPQAQVISREILSLAFSAKAMDVNIDLASFRANVTPAWQQACTETNGCFLAFESIGDVQKWALQPNQAVALRRSAGKLFGAFLSFFWLHPFTVREVCGSYPQSTAESTATCCCHNRKVTLGKVCTDCFAVHCLEDGVPEHCVMCGPGTRFPSIPEDGKESGEQSEG